MDVTISLFRAGVGGYVGGGQVHPALLDAAREGLAEAKESGRVADGFVARCGDDIDLVLLHEVGDARAIALEIFGQAASAGTRLRQHGGNGGVKVDGAELRLAPRPREPVLCFFSNRAGRGALNVHLYKLFADPFVSTGLVTDPALTEGFRFVVRDRVGIDEVFDVPAGLYKLLGAVRAGACIIRVESRASGEAAASVSAGRDPVLVVRCESPFPGVEDALEAFAAQGAMGSSSGQGPLVPVSANGDATARSMPRAIGLGFQVMPDRLVGPRDLLGDAAFDDLRREALHSARLARSSAAIRAADEVSTAI
ncbi:MAG: fructose 1,6-bisphosphatase [Actinomycetota bacterium]